MSDIAAPHVYKKFLKKFSTIPCFILPDHNHILYISDFLKKILKSSKKNYLTSAKIDVNMITQLHKSDIHNKIELPMNLCVISVTRCLSR